MRKTLMTCLLLVSVTCVLSAQVRKPDFKNSMLRFASFINYRDYDRARSELSTLSGMMSAQMTYLNSAIIIMQKRYSADPLKAAADLKNAQSSPDANSAQTVSAQYEVKRATEALAVLNKARNR